MKYGKPSARSVYSIMPAVPVLMTESLAVLERKGPLYLLRVTGKAKLRVVRIRAVSPVVFSTLIAIPVDGTVEGWEGVITKPEKNPGVVGAVTIGVIALTGSIALQ